MTGVEDYSGFEVIRAAMEIEKNGHRFYTEMAQQAQSELVREVFTWLAQDEVQHLRTLESLVSKYEAGSFWEDEEEFLPYLRRFADREIFPSGEQLVKALEGETPDMKALDLAIEAEERFAEYFRLAASKARTSEGQEAFAWLASEEESHAGALKDRRVRLRTLRQS